MQKHPVKAMVQKCCVSSCESRAYKNAKMSFHKFPMEYERRQKWFAAVNINESRRMKNNDLRVCSLHFRWSDYIFGGNVKKLKRAAIPRVNKPLVAKEENGCLKIMTSAPFGNTLVKKIENAGISSTGGSHFDWFTQSGAERSISPSQLMHYPTIKVEPIDYLDNDFSPVIKTEIKEEIDLKHEDLASPLIPSSNENHTEGHVLCKHPLDNQNRVKWIRCALCEFKTKDFASLQLHLMDQHPPESETRWWHHDHCYCKSRRNGLMITIHKTLVEECEQCGFISKNASVLRKHMLEHSSKPKAKLSLTKLFRCIHCRFTTTKNGPDLMRQHMTEKHSLDNSY